MQTFYIGIFQFFPFHDVDDMDVCLYQFTLGDYMILITFVGIDATVPCGTQSNVDFVHFISLNSDMLCFRRHALTFLPTSLHNNGPLLCLQHYRIASMGWSFVSRCVPCTDRFREHLRPLTGCLAPAENCPCNICKRQPPTIREMSLQVPFTMSYKIDLFELTRDVTHEQNVHAITSGRTTVTGLLPPDFPFVTIRFQYPSCSSRSYHRHPNHELPWRATADRTFQSAEDAIRALYSRRDQFLCAWCEKPLFFYIHVSYMETMRTGTMKINFQKTIASNPEF
jgi:hypothetical protein